MPWIMGSTIVYWLLLLFFPCKFELIHLAPVITLDYVYSSQGLVINQSKINNSPFFKIELSAQLFYCFILCKFKSNIFMSQIHLTFLWTSFLISSEIEIIRILPLSVYNWCEEENYMWGTVNWYFKSNWKTPRIILFAYSVSVGQY